MYLQGTERIITYGASVWFSRRVCVVKKLLSAQRIPLLGISRAYRTTSIDALQILTGVKPIDLKIMDEIVAKKIAGGESTIPLINEEWRSPPILIMPSLIHPCRHYNYSLGFCTSCRYGWELFTDGSRTIKILEKDCDAEQQLSLEERTIIRVGRGVVAKYNGVTTFMVSYRLDDHASVFQAELSTIKIAFEWAKKQHLEKLLCFQTPDYH